MIIDTSVLIEIENKNVDILKQLNNLKESPKSDLSITFFTFCEFYTGIMRRNKKNKELALQTLNNYKLLNTTMWSGIIFCEIIDLLKKNGDSIPIFDALIASIAIENNLVLVTLDSHFKKIPNLKVILLKI